MDDDGLAQYARALIAARIPEMSAAELVALLGRGRSGRWARGLNGRVLFRTASLRRSHAGFGV
jgi:hypothetical protein